MHNLDIYISSGHSVKFSVKIWLASIWAVVMGQEGKNVEQNM